MDNVTDGQTDGRTDDIMMPIAAIMYVAVVFDQLKRSRQESWARLSQRWQRVRDAPYIQGGSN